MFMSSIVFPGCGRIDATAINPIFPLDWPVASRLDIVSSYTVRLTTYRLGKLMSSLDTDPQGLFQNLSSFVAALPPYLHPIHPDISLDEEYPFLSFHRNYLAAMICLVACAVYRREVAVENRMGFCLRLLKACADQFKSLQKHHYRQFLLVYHNLEPSVLICEDILREIRNGPGLAGLNFSVVANKLRDDEVNCYPEFELNA
ncbi:hypothetical protein V1507DRAFT_119078 [Lipomyces tetrasporus]